MNRKFMEVAEFRSKGYLQELNRRFLHPLGLALEIIIHDDGTESIGRIWDSRDDTEGFIYGDESEFDQERFDKWKNIDDEMAARFKPRFDNLGYWIQPIPGALEHVMEETKD